MARTLRTTKLIENCTPSISYDSQVQSASHSFDRQMWEIIDETGQVCFIPNIMGLTNERLVDILAWQFNVDAYDATRDLEFRKNLVQMSIIWHKTKGTVALVEEVIRTYYAEGAWLHEWFEYMSPLPPNYPDSDPDTQVVTFNAADVNVAQSTFNLVGHPFYENQYVRFTPGTGGTLPAPLVQGQWYYIVNRTTNSFQVANYADGQFIVLTSDGGAIDNAVWTAPRTWHGRYRFQVMVNLAIPETEDAAVLKLIERYKPVSRWLDYPYEIVRPYAGYCQNIFICAVAQIFVQLESTITPRP